MLIASILLNVLQFIFGVIVYLRSEKEKEKRHKLDEKLRTHPERKAYYNYVTSYISNMQSGTIKKHYSQELLSNTRNIDLYFGDEVVKFVDELYSRTLYLEKIEREWKELRADQAEKKEILMKTWEEVRKWLDDSMNKAKEIMAPYVKVVD